MLVLLFTLSGTVFATDQPLSTEETAIRVREIIELRTTNSETYLMSDGTRQCVVFSDDKYYETGNSLQLIDNSIVAESSSDKLAATGSSVSRYQNKANSHKTTFSGSGTPYISMEKDGYSVSFSPTVASATLSLASAASRSFAPASSNISIGKVNDCAPLSAIAHTGSNTATYADVFTDTDLVYVVKNNALKEYIILNSDSAPNAFSFTYTMDGLTLQNVEGSLCFTDPKGTPIFTLGNLFAVDARGAFTEAVTYSYTTNAYTGTATVTVTLDEEYLSAADRAFPVVIDPTIMISSVYTADAFVSSYYPNTNYYTGFHLRTGFDADYGIRRSYIKFNIPDTVPLDDILFATLEVQKSYGSTPSVRAYRVTGNWSSSTIKWNNKPGYTLDGGSTTSSVQSNGVWYTMYVTNIVKAWANTSTPNYGFLLKDLIEDDPNHYALFYSSDCDDGYRPELAIDYMVHNDTEEEDDPTPYVDAWLMANNLDLYDRWHQPIDTHSFFQPVSNFVAEYRNGDVSTEHYSSVSKETIIDRMQSANIFIILTHGRLDGIQLNNATNESEKVWLSSSDLVGVDLSNLDFVILIACETTSRSGGNAPVEFVEQLTDCGVGTVLGFTGIVQADDAMLYIQNIFNITAQMYEQEGFCRTIGEVVNILRQNSSYEGNSNGMASVKGESGYRLIP